VNCVAVTPGLSRVVEYTLVYGDTTWPTFAVKLRSAEVVETVYEKV
jgi:hypothetical protein